MGVLGQRQAPAASSLAKTFGTHFTRGWYGQRDSLDVYRKSLPPPVLDVRTFQPVASLYADHAILAHDDIPLPYTLHLIR